MYHRQSSPEDYNFNGSIAIEAHRGVGYLADWLLMFDGTTWFLFDWGSYGSTPTYFLYKSEQDVEVGNWVESGDFFTPNNDPVITCICNKIQVTGSEENGLYSLVTTDPLDYGDPEFAYKRNLGDWVITYNGGTWASFDSVTSPGGVTPRYYNINSSLDPSVGTWQDDPINVYAPNSNPTMTFYGC